MFLAFYLLCPLYAPIIREFQDRLYISMKKIKMINTEQLTLRNEKHLTSNLSCVLLASLGLLVGVNAHAEEDYDLEVTISKKGEVSQNQVAFVPFAGDSNTSQIIQKDLQATPLKVTSEGLIGQPHSRDDLAATLPGLAAAAKHSVYGYW